MNHPTAFTWDAEACVMSPKWPRLAASRFEGGRDYLLADVEQWRVIPSCPDYEASSFGRVRRLTPILGGQGSKRPAGHILKPRSLPTGHLRVTLSSGNRPLDRLVHRLVAEAFHGAPDRPGLFACHKDDNPENNTPSNLYWGSRTDNADDAKRNNRVARGERVASAKLSAQQVEEVRFAYLAGRTQRQIAKDFGVSQSNVSQICSGATWRAP